MLLVCEAAKSARAGRQARVLSEFGNGRDPGLGHRRNRGRALPCRFLIIYVYKLSVRCKPDLSQKMNSICGRDSEAKYLRTYINET
jgi:hypothetical protein